MEELERQIREAYIFLRQKNMSIPSDTLQFMLDASLEKLKDIKEAQKAESKEIKCNLDNPEDCINCGS